MYNAISYVSIALVYTYGAHFIYEMYMRILKPNIHRLHRRDSTVASRRRRRCVLNSQLAHDDCRPIRSTIWKLNIAVRLREF